MTHHRTLLLAPISWFDLGVWFLANSIRSTGWSQRSLILFLEIMSHVLLLGYTVLAKMTKTYFYAFFMPAAVTIYYPLHIRLVRPQVKVQVQRVGA